MRQVVGQLGILYICFSSSGGGGFIFVFIFGLMYRSKEGQRKRGKEVVARHDGQAVELVDVFICLCLCFLCLPIYFLSLSLFPSCPFLVEQASKGVN